MSQLKVISPVDNSHYHVCIFDTEKDVERTLILAKKAQKLWQKTPLSHRKKYVQKMVDVIVSKKDKIAEEICWQMGRPVVQAGGEILGFKERADYMMSVSEKALTPYSPKPVDGFTRYIIRESLWALLLFYHRGTTHF